MSMWPFHNALIAKTSARETGYESRGNARYRAPLLRKPKMGKMKQYLVATLAIMLSTFAYAGTITNITQGADGILTKEEMKWSITLVENKKLASSALAVSGLLICVGALWSMARKNNGKGYLIKASFAQRLFGRLEIVGNVDAVALVLGVFLLLVGGVSYQLEIVYSAVI